MKRLIIAASLLFSAASMAQTTIDIDTHGLTNEQKAELVKQVEQMKSATNAIDANIPTVAQIDQWANVGEHIGKMMGGAAKEVGVAVNDFVKTPVGVMTAGLIIWNYMGSMIVHVVSGWAMLIIMFSILTHIVKINKHYDITYDKAAGRNWLGRYPILKVERQTMDSDVAITIFIGYLVALIVSVWTMFAW